MENGMFIVIDSDFSEDEVTTAIKQTIQTRKRKRGKSRGGTPGKNGKQLKISGFLDGQSSKPTQTSVTIRNQSFTKQSAHNSVDNGCTATQINNHQSFTKQSTLNSVRSGWTSAQTSYQSFKKQSTLSNGCTSTQNNGSRLSNQSFITSGCTASSSKLSVAPPPRPAAFVSSGVSGGACLTRCKECAAYELPWMSEEDKRQMKDYVALDCEFVGVGEKKSNGLGRCSIVDYQGAVLYDRFVKPGEPVTDYRTPWSGLRPRDLCNGIPFEVARQQISAVIQGKIVVGHSVHTDFKVMKVDHPSSSIRDTQGCELLREMANSGRKCSLKMLTQVLLGRKIQKGEHCSVSDARATLDLFRLVRARWEPALMEKLGAREKRRQARAEQKPCKQPMLTSYFEDQYWPSNLFE